MADALTKWKAAGYEVQREFKGSEGFPNAFLLGPDKLRFELQEDTTLKVPAVAITCTTGCPTTPSCGTGTWTTSGCRPASSGNFEVRGSAGDALDVRNRRRRPHGRH